MASGRHTEGNKKGFVSIALVVLLVAAVAGLGWVAFGPDSDGSAGACESNRPVVISVVQPMQGAMEEAIADLKAGDECFPAELRTESPKDVETSFFNGGRPDLWVADSPARVERLAGIGINTTTLIQSLALTPVGLLGNRDADQFSSWAEALESRTVRLVSPEEDPASAVALTAPAMEAAKTGFDGDRIDLGVVTVAQEYGNLLRDGEITPVNLAEIGAGSSLVHPVTEQQYISSGADNAELKNVTPGTGAPALTFPLVKANGGAPDTDVVANAIRQWFESSKGQAALTDEGLRAPGGEPLKGQGFADSKLFREIPTEAFSGLIGKFNVLSVPSSILAVYDLSGSMNFAAPGGGTRMELAADAGRAALEQFPPQTRIGLWGFSIDQGGDGQDWIDMAPIKRLDEQTQGQAHEEYLRKRLNDMLGRVQGGTGLFDTTLAAYKHAIEAYDRNYFNAVILMTDGSNEDEGSISKEKLLQQLKELRDPNRPVRVIAIGITRDAGMEDLQDIAIATGGSAHLAEQPEDILGVLAEAVSSRR